jgi:ABC-2 type transport system ATP-binding protein
MVQPAVSVRNVTKNFRLYHEKNQYLKTALLRGRRARFDEFRALNGITFDIPHGSTFGIIGSNGSGKSTLLKCLTGILTPDSGNVDVHGKVAALLELGSGFHPDLSGRENVYLNGAILGMSHRELEDKFDEIVDFAGLKQFIDTPVKNYSSGMTVRLGFAIAINVNPEILIIDEVLAVGDDEFQLKCYEKIDQFRRAGKTIIIVSHGLGDIQRICDEVAWIEKGVLKRVGDPAEIVPEYLSTSRSGTSSVEPSSGQQWGSGEVTFESITFLDEQQQPTNTLRTGAPATVRVSMRSSVSLENSLLTLRISDMNNDNVWMSNSNQNDAPLPVEPGSITVDVGLADLPLLDGVYELSLAIGNMSGSHEYDHWEKRVKFNVHQKRTVESGIVSIGSTWRKR